MFKVFLMLLVKVVHRSQFDFSLFSLLWRFWASVSIKFEISEVLFIRNILDFSISLKTFDANEKKRSEGVLNLSVIGGNFWRAFGKCSTDGIFGSFFMDFLRTLFELEAMKERVTCKLVRCHFGLFVVRGSFLLVGQTEITWEVGGWTADRRKFYFALEPPQL